VYFSVCGSVFLCLYVCTYVCVVSPVMCECDLCGGFLCERLHVCVFVLYMLGFVFARFCECVSVCLRYCVCACVIVCVFLCERVRACV